MRFKAGEFRHPIIIERYSIDKKDDDGIPLEEWEGLVDTKAKITGVKEDEIQIAEGQGSKESRNFYIRKPISVKITRKDRIYFDGDLFNIKSVSDIKSKGRYLKIKGELKE